jgi:hypothetical protein
MEMDERKKSPAADKIGVAQSPKSSNSRTDVILATQSGTCQGKKQQCPNVAIGTNRKI